MFLFMFSNSDINTLLSLIRINYDKYYAQLYRPSEINSGRPSAAETLKIV